jgi:hypothetical protein
MTPADQRPDPPEPTPGEVLALLKFHSIQLKRVTIGIVAILEAIVKLSDNMSSLFNDQADNSSGLDTIEDKLIQIKTTQEEIKNIQKQHTKLLNQILNALMKGPTNN